MPTPPRPKLSKPALRSAFKTDLEAAWTSFQARYPSHEPYAFIVYGMEDGPNLSPQVLTEQGLTQVAGRYVREGYYDTLEEARASLRYSVEDSPHFAEGEGRLPGVDGLVGPVAEALDDEAGYELLATAAIDALRALDGGGLFGSGARRGRLLLTVILQDAEADWGGKSARRLNPKPVWQRFEEETKVEGGYASCEGLAVSPDGRSVYSFGTRDDSEADPDDDDAESFSEVVAYDLRGPQLSRRWTFSFPPFGDSARALACAPDGSSVLVLRAKYIESKPHAVLMRFGRDSNAPAGQHQVPGSPSSFALSPDGSRVAVAMHDKTLHLFDADLRPLHVRKLPAVPAGLCFLNPRKLLVATDTAVLALDPAKSAAPASLRLRAHRLCTDDAGKLLAVSAWLPAYGQEKKHPKSSGVHLLRLPSLKPLREVVVPGHRAVNAVLSPDGRLLAFEAHESDTPRKFVAVFDTATGREIARRKSDFVRDLAFLRDSRTLAIPKSGHMKGEPIDLWTVPGV